MKKFRKFMLMSALLCGFSFVAPTTASAWNYIDEIKSQDHFVEVKEVVLNDGTTVVVAKTRKGEILVYTTDKDGNVVKRSSQH